MCRGLGNRVSCLWCVGGFVAEDVEDGGLGDGCYFVVAEGAFHAFDQYFDGVLEVVGLHHVGLGNAFFDLFFFVDGEVVDFTAVPFVAFVVVDHFGDFAAADGGDGEFAGGKGLTFFAYPCFGFGKREGVDEIGFGDFFDRAVVGCAVEGDFTFKPGVHVVCRLVIGGQN